MKILQVTFRNLNSLTGTHTIDLSSGALANAGIFAITGPTGAGKSTILDAITLALYGRAARYENEANPEDMMSRHTGECSAEVVFEVPDGRFRAAWHLNRAHKKHDRKVQPPKRFLYDANEQPIAQKINEVNQRITELIGLDADRFLRSVLLAQNEFAKFLRASANDRARLLESLTGTDIYSRLGQLTHEMHAAKENELKSQMQQIDAIELLEPEQRKEIETEKTAITPRVGKLGEQLESIRAEIGRGEQLVKSLALQKTLEAIRIALQKEDNAFSDSNRKLDLHKRASKFRDDLLAVDHATKTRQVSDESLSQAKAEFAASSARLQCAVNAVGTFSVGLDTQIATRIEKLQEERAAGELESSTLAKWLDQHAIDADLVSANSEIGVGMEKLATARRSRVQLTEQQAATDSKSKQAKADVAALEDSLTATANKKKSQDSLVTNARSQLAEVSDSKTIVQIEGEMEGVRSLLQGLRELSEKFTRRDELNEVRNTANNIVAKISSTCDAARVQLAESKSQTEKQQELVDALRESFSRGQLVARLAEHRHDLESGEPCPLCGAIEHPYAQENPISESALQSEGRRLREAEVEFKRLDKLRTVADEEFRKYERKLEAETRHRESIATQCNEMQSEINDRAKEMKVNAPDRAAIIAGISLQMQKEAASKQQLSAIRAAESAVAEAEKSAIAAAGEWKQAQTELSAGKARAEAIRDEIESAKKNIVEADGKVEKESATVVKLVERFLPENERLPEPGLEEQFRKQLVARADAFRAANEKQTAIVESLKRLADQQRQLEVERKSIESTAEKTCESAEETLALPSVDAVTAADLDRIRTEFQSTVDEWESMDDAVNTVESLRSKRDAARATVLERESKTKADSAELTLLQEALAARITESSCDRINSVDDVRAALLSDRQVAELNAARADLDNRISENRGELNTVVTGLAELRKLKTPDDQGLALRRKEVKVLQTDWESLQKQLTESDMRLRTDDANRQLRDRRKQEIQEEVRQLESWRRLRVLIGSADGRKFRVFAQGLSLDVLVRLANKHLEKLSERYRLRRVEGDQLDLEICDQHQAGTRRPMKSLSGGESFIASLALALGLSDLAGRNVRIDSLFIDEGFGSLDPETLDVAVAALEGLQSSNKTIGVISHVELLKERITTQIRVTPKGGGVSELSIVS